MPAPLAYPVAVRAQSDASLLADLTIVPAIVWAAVWTLVSVTVLLGGAWLALRDAPDVRRNTPH